MTADDDEEALTWAGGRDPSHYETPEVKAPKAQKRSAKTAGPAGPDADESAEDLPPATSAALLITIGVIAGIYLLYTVGWLVSWQRFQYVAADQLDQAAFLVQQLAAIVAPALWFVVSFLYTRGSKPVTRLLWLVAGALLLIPWPFVFGS